MPLRNFWILHALKCVLGASEAPFRACIQYIHTWSYRLRLAVSIKKYDIWDPSQQLCSSHVR